MEAFLLLQLVWNPGQENQEELTLFALVGLNAFLSSPNLPKDGLSGPLFIILIGMMV